MARTFFALLVLSWGISPTAVSAQSRALADESEAAARMEVAEDFEEAEEGEIETDRDSFTPAATVVGRSRLVLESAYSFIDNRSVPETHSFPEFLVRYGIADFLEMRFGTNYEIGGAGNPISANAPDDFAEFAELEESTKVGYGVKLALSDQIGWVPSSALLISGITPVAGEETDTSFVATYVAGYTFENRWTWDSAIRYSTGSFEEDHFNVWSPSTVLKIPFGEQWKGHVEYFSVLSEGRETESTQHFFSPGIHYLITPNWELGTRFGWVLNDQAPDFFVNVGGGIRF